jgi:hypothetical protein
MLRNEPYTNRAGYTFTPHEDSVIAADVFEPDACHLPWVAFQDRIWVDRWGHIHDVDLMPQSYLLNVFALIHRYAARQETAERTSAILESPLVSYLHSCLSAEPPTMIVFTLAPEVEPLEPGEYRTAVVDGIANMTNMVVPDETRRTEPDATVLGWMIERFKNVER